MSSHPKRLCDIFGNPPAMLSHDPGPLKGGIVDGWNVADERHDREGCPGCHYLKCSCPPKAEAPSKQQSVSDIAGDSCARDFLKGNGFAWSDGWWNRETCHIRKNGECWDMCVDGQAIQLAGALTFAVDWCKTQLGPDVEIDTPAGAGELDAWPIAKAAGFAFANGWWSRDACHFRRGNYQWEMCHKPGVDIARSFADDIESAINWCSAWAEPAAQSESVTPYEAGDLDQRETALENGFTWCAGWWIRGGDRMRRLPSLNWHVCHGDSAIILDTLTAAIGFLDRKSPAPTTPVAPGSGDPADWLVAQRNGFLWLDGYWGKGGWRIRQAIIDENGLRRETGLWEVTYGDGGVCTPRSMSLRDALRVVESRKASQVRRAEHVAIALGFSK